MTEISSKSKNMSSSVSCDRDEDAFCGFDHCMTTDTSIYKNLSSYVETLIQKSPKKVRTKKRMSKAEANYKTELFNMCKKVSFLFSYELWHIAINLWYVCKYVSLYDL